MINLDKVSEGIHYELIPVEEHTNSQAWHIRITQGTFVETTISFGNVAIHPDGERLSFNFDVVSSPDDDLTVEDVELQDFVTEILEDVLERAITDGTLQTKEQSKRVD